MSEKQDEKMKIENIEEIAEKAERGEDISEYFTGQHIAKQRVNIDFPLSLLRMIDAECKRVGITRQAWVKMACDEKLRLNAGLGEPVPSSTIPPSPSSKLSSPEGGPSTGPVRKLRIPKKG